MLWSHQLLSAWLSWGSAATPGSRRSWFSPQPSAEQFTASMNCVVCSGKFLLALCCWQNHAEFGCWICSLQSSEQLPGHSRNRLKFPSLLRITGEAAGQAGGWQGSGGMLCLSPSGYRCWAELYLRGTWCLPSPLLRDQCRAVSPSVFSPFLFQCFVTFFLPEMLELAY